MFRWFEKRLDPFPIEETAEPPKTLIAFCVHFTRGAWPYIAIDAVLIAAIAITEVWMFQFLGSIVDWLSAHDRETFLQTEGWKLAGMAFVVLVLLPGTVWFQSLIHTQTLMGNHPGRIPAGLQLPSSLDMTWSETNCWSACRQISICFIRETRKARPAKSPSSGPAKKDK